jgi:DNA-binding response OmpR family regulator
VFLIREAIETAGITADIHVVSDGQAAIKFIDAADGRDDAPCPGLVMLDISLPRKNGDEVLMHIRECSKCRDATVIVVSTSDSAADREKMKQLGSDGYFPKPSEYEAFYETRRCG